MATKKHRALGDALKASVASEDEALRRRFEQADRVLIPVTPAQEMASAVTQRSHGREAPKGVVRLAYSLPPDEAAMLDDMQLRAARGGHLLNRSELVRAAILALDAMPATDFERAIRAVIHLKPGRPAGTL